MKNRIFRGSLQQDAQEFLRCLLSQIHEEIGLVLPEGVSCGCGQQSCDCVHRHSSISNVSHESNASNNSTSVLVRSASSSPVTPKRKISGSPTFSSLRRKSSTYKKLKGSKASLDKVPASLQAEQSPGAGARDVFWKEGDVFEADLETGLVTLHSPEQDKDGLDTPDLKPTDVQPEPDVDGASQMEKSCEDAAACASDIQPTATLETAGSSVDPSSQEPVVLREKTEKKNGKKGISSHHS